jgi:hypothetical protein
MRTWAIMAIPRRRTIEPARRTPTSTTAAMAQATVEPATPPSSKRGRTTSSTMRPSTSEVATVAPA